MASKQLTIVLPGFAPLLNAQLNQLEIPHYLNKLIKKANFTVNHDSLDVRLYTLLYAVRSQNDYPMAKLRQQDASFCADPCYVYADQGRLLLFHQDIALTDEEVAGFIEHLQPLFNEYHMQLLAYTNQQWIARTSLAELPEMVSISQLEAKPVLSALPTGENASEFVKLWNEIQMSLFEHPLNIQREQQGKLPVNSVWFWGKGDVPKRQVEWNALWGQHALLAQAKAIDAFSLNAIAGKNLYCQPELNWQGDWQLQLQQLDEQLLKPVWHSLRYGKLKRLTLLVPEMGDYQLTPLKTWF